MEHRKKPTRQSTPPCSNQGAARVPDPTLSDAELERLTGYKRPADQLRELQDQGFWRARLSKTTGKVILERPHFEAVSCGAKPPQASPKVRLMVKHA